MIKYKKLDKNITVTSKTSCCLNCQFCYIPNDFLLGLDKAQLYCNVSKDKPLSGDILSEPFNYYDSEVYFAQEEKWDKWSESHKVQYDGVCDSFERAK